MLNLVGCLRRDGSRAQATRQNTLCRASHRLYFESSESRHSSNTSHRPNNFHTVLVTFRFEWCVGITALKALVCVTGRTILIKARRMQSKSYRWVALWLTQSKSPATIWSNATKAPKFILWIRDKIIASQKKRLQHILHSETNTKGTWKTLQTLQAKLPVRSPDLDQISTTAQNYKLNGTHRCSFGAESDRNTYRRSVFWRATHSNGWFGITRWATVNCYE